jgi:hypothetical protein
MSDIGNFNNGFAALQRLEYRNTARIADAIQFRTARWFAMRVSLIALHVRTEHSK